MTAFLPSQTTTVALDGEREDFAWMPEAVELGWRREDRAAGRRDRASASETVLVAELEDGPGGTWGERARIAIRSLSVGYGLWRRRSARGSRTCSTALTAAPVGCRGRRALAPRSRPDPCGGRGDALRRRTTYGPSPATRTGMSSACRRRSSRRGIRRATASSTSPGASPPSWRIASTCARSISSASRPRAPSAGGCRPRRLTPRARGDTLAFRAETPFPEPAVVRSTTDPASPVRSPPRHPRRAASLRLAPPHRQAGAACQPRRAARGGHADLPRHRRL